MTNNVYAPPNAPLSDYATTEMQAAVRLREQHISHQASIRGVGSLFYFCGAMVVLGTVVVVCSELSDDTFSDNALLYALVLGFFIVYAISSSYIA